MADNRVDKETAGKRIAEQWKGVAQCPVCHSNHWVISENFLEVREFSAGNLVVGGPVYPLVGLTCKTCGNTLLFNALVLGLMKPPQPEPTTDPEKELTSTK